jgi:hypothetical protein
LRPTYDPMVDKKKQLLYDIQRERHTGFSVYFFVRLKRSRPR